MNFSQFLLALRARFKIFASVVVLAVLAAATVSLLLSKTYNATVSLLVDAKDEQLFNNNQRNYMQPQERLNYLQTQIDILTSEKVARKVVQDLKLGDNPELRASLGSDAADPATLEQHIAEGLIRKLKVETTQSNVIRATFPSRSPDLSANVANGFAKAYLDTTLQLRVEPTKEAAAWFEEQLKTLKGNLEDAQAKLARFEEKTGIVSADEQYDVENTRLAALSDQVAKAQELRSQWGSREQQARLAGSPDRLPAVMDSPVIQKLKADLAAGESKMQQLATQYGVNHPSYENQAAENRVLRERLNAEMNRVVGSIESASRQSSAQEAQAMGALAAQRARVLSMKENRGELQVLKRNVESAEHAYDLAMQRYVENQVESHARETNVSILNPAVAPSLPSSPKIGLNVGLAAIIGALLGFGIIILMEMLDRRVRSRSDLFEEWNVPLLGTLSAWTPSEVPALAAPGSRLLPSSD
jgi:chain length determinant protein EpsF